MYEVTCDVEHCLSELSQEGCGMRKLLAMAKRDGWKIPRAKDDPHLCPEHTSTPTETDR